MDYYIGVDGVQEGPLPETEIRQRIAWGQLQAHHLCWTEGWSEWKSVQEAFPEAFAPAAPPPVPMPPPVAVPHVTEYAPAGSATPTATSGTAIASLILGILGFSIVTPIPAVVCGHIALSSIRRSGGRLSGGGLAVAGLVLGYVWMGFCFLMLPAVLIPAFVNAREAAQHQASTTNLRLIAVAGLQYAVEHKDALPDTGEDLTRAGLIAPDVLDLPYTPEVESAGYVFVPGRTASMPSATIFAYESIPRKDGSVGVVRIDGTVEILPPHATELEQLQSGKY